MRGPRAGPRATGDGAVDPTAGMTADQRIHWSVVHRKKEGIEALLDAAGVREQPVRVLNEVLLPAMKEVGDKFGAGELILPFVLQSAEVMKRAVEHLEQFLERSEGYTKGKVVLATVYGDVHDIGKSLVNTILANNGYTVYDLGKQVPVNTIIEKAEEVGADAIGLSALLVSTSKQMPLCVQELDRRGLTYPVLIGGAAINRRFGRRALFVDGERPYAAGVFYCKDAFEGLAMMDQLMDHRPPRRRSVARTRRCGAAATCSCIRPSARTSPPAPAGRSGAPSRADVPVPRGAVLRHARPARHPARRGLSAPRPRRVVPPAMGRSWLRARVRAHRAEEFLPALRAAHRRGGARRLARATGRLRRVSLCSRTATTWSSTTPRHTRATAARCARLPASTSLARSAASGCASPTISDRSTRARSMSSRCRS